MSAYAAQVATELRLTSRQGEQLLVSLGIPLLLLVFFSQVDVLPTGDQDAIDFLTPGILALAIMGNAMVSLGIGTGFDRQYGVLKRLGSTPLGRPRLIAAKTTNVLVIDLVQVVLIVSVAFVLGWDPSASSGLALVSVLLGTAAFAGIGLALAGRLPGLTNLAVTNGLYIVLLLFGGMVFPLDELPGPLETLAKLTPAAALSETLRDAFSGAGVDGAAFAVLLVWAIAAPMMAAATFRWEP